MFASETDVKWKNVISPVSLVRTKAVWSFKDFYTGSRFNKKPKVRNGFNGKSEARNLKIKTNSNDAKLKLPNKVDSDWGFDFSSHLG